jgi:hypothetical protein
MVFSAAFNNISVISWRSVLLEETGVHGESHRSVFSGVRVTRSLVFHVCFNCRSLFVLLYFFFCSWCCLFFFDIRLYNVLRRILFCLCMWPSLIWKWGHHGSHRMVVGFTTTCAISEFEPRSWRWVFDTICDKFVSENSLKIPKGGNHKGSHT